MSQSLAIEVDANYDFFLRHLREYVESHAGQYALLKNRSVIEFFDKPGDAYRYAKGAFEDGIFSIQEVTEEPIDLGFFSHVGN